jgi:predicted metal-dependent phosphoesterase TrpH
VPSVDPGLRPAPAASVVTTTNPQRLSPRPPDPGPVTESEFRVDPHVKILDDRVVQRAKRRGLDALVYAPHFTRLPDIRARARRFSDEELLVLPAREVFTGSFRQRKHVLAVGLSEPVPDFITLDAAMAEFDRQDAAVLAPHPEFATVSLDADDLAEYRDTVDAIEVYNPKHLPGHNERAGELARETGLPVFGSSYAHLRGTIGEVWTTFEEPLWSERELVGAFQEGLPRRVHHRDAPGHGARCFAETAHLLYENTWEKVDRLFLQGTEPTHPRHIAYDGRFDDVAVY